MVLELGPVDASETLAWTKFARRLMVELRADPCELAGIATDDFLRPWADLIGQWAEEAGAPDTHEFRWTQSIDDDVAEFLLHGLERCMASPSVAGRVSPDEILRHSRFTRHVAKAFIAGLTIEGRPCEHYTERLEAL